MWLTWLGLLFFFLLIVVACSWASWRSTSRFEIRLPFILLGIMPAVLWLLVSGQIQSFTGFGVSFQMREVLAREVSLEEQGQRVHTVRLDESVEELIDPGRVRQKGDVAQIDIFVRERVEALEYVVGRQYSTDATYQYLVELRARDPNFKAVVFVNDNGFVGFIDPVKLITQIRTGLPFAEKVRDGNLDDIGGVVSEAISLQATNGEAIEKFKKTGLSRLPVTKNGRFVGFLERTKLFESVLDDLLQASGERS